MYKMHFLSTTLKAKLEEIARQVLGMELALLVMVMALFLVVYIVR